MVYPGCSDNGSAGTRWALRGIAALHVAGSVLVLPQDLFVFLLVLLTGVCGIRASCDPRRGAPYLVMSSTLLVYHAAHVMRLCQNLALVSAPAGSLPGAPFPALPVLLALARLALSVVAVALGVACVGAAGPGLGPTAPGWGSGDGRAASPSLGDGQLRGASPCPEPPPTQDPTLWPQGRPAGGQVGGGVASCRPPAGGVPGPGAPAGARRALRVVAVLHLVGGALFLRWGWPALLLSLSTGVCGIRASDDPGRVAPCLALSGATLAYAAWSAVALAQGIGAVRDLGLSPEEWALFVGPLTSQATFILAWLALSGTSLGLCLVIRGRRGAGRLGP